MAEQTLKEKTAKGFFWGGMSNGLLQVINLLFAVIIGRILSPSDYGVVGVLTIFTAIATTMQESGFTAALVNRKDVDARDYNSVFWFNILIGTTLYLVLFFLAPLIARFFHNPVLVQLSRFTFLGFLIGSFGTAQNAWLLKHMQIKQKAIASIISVVVAGTVAVILALNGFSYWGIAIQNVVSVFVNTLCLWLASSWRPSFPISLRRAWDMFGFSVKILITNTVAMANYHLFSVVFGRYYTEYEVGVYNQANKWNSAGYSTIDGMVHSIVLPALVEAREDKDRQTRVFRKMLRFVAFVSFPLMLGLSLVAPEFITIFLTDKWAESGYLLRLLSVGGSFYAITTVLILLIISHGGSGVQMWNSIAIGIVQILVCICFFRWGVTAMVVASMAVNVGWLLIWHRCVNLYISYALWDFIKDIGYFALVAASVMVVTFFTTAFIDNIYVRFFSRIVLAAGLYLAVMRISGAEIFKECMQFIGSKLRRQA